MFPDFKATLVYVLGAMGPLGRMFTALEEGKRENVREYFTKDIMLERKDDRGIWEIDNGGNIS